MKNCPHCRSEMEDDFDICWNCNFSISENKVIIFPGDPVVERKAIDCLRCRVPLDFKGNFKFHEGKRYGVFGDIFETLMNRESFDLYICRTCGKVEFYAPQAEEKK